MCTTGEKIKELRLKKKLSRKKLSQISGVSESHITFIEMNMRNPTLNTIRKISKALGVKILNVIQEEEKQCVSVGEKLDKTFKKLNIDTSNLTNEQLNLIISQALLTLKLLEK